MLRLNLGAIACRWQKLYLVESTRSETALEGAVGRDAANGWRAAIPGGLVNLNNRSERSGGD